MAESQSNPGEASALSFPAKESREARRWAELALHESDIIKCCSTVAGRTTQKFTKEQVDGRSAHLK